MAGFTLGVNPGSIGIYNLSGGSFTPNYLDVGGQGTGTFNQTGGSVTGLTLNAYLSVNSLGTYNLSGTGVLAQGPSGSTDIMGTFNQYGGVNYIGDWGMFISGGTYNLSGGQLTMPTGSIDNNGTFKYSGGELHIFGNQYPGQLPDALTNNGTVLLSQNGTRTMEPGTLLPTLHNLSPK